MLLNYQQKQAALDEADQKFENIFVLHGLFGNLSNLDRLAVELQQQHKVISVDLRNHGNSPHIPSISYPEMANDLFALADHLNIGNFSIIGHSMGGKVAMTCALQQPERINKLVVVDIAPINYENKHQDIFNALQALTKHTIESRKSADLLLSEYIKTAEIRQFLLKSLVKKENKYQLKFNLPAIMANYDLIRAWPVENKQFDKDTLFIKGANSNYITSEKQNDIVRFFPKAKAKIIANTGHWLHAEKPKIFNRIVKQFFTIPPA